MTPPSPAERVTAPGAQVPARAQRRRPPQDPVLQRVLVLVEERERDRGDVRVAPVEQLASVLVDRYGLLRLPRRPISKPRLLGVAVLLGGVALITVAA